ncbi:hypothetical protein [Tsukamurella paurometabola]|uniref:SMI1/KNR4 family protein n=1 Tax=Tsukamurella paurometabola TaxID=2061 RepID=A0ABS5NKD4_TSUPA|nr:hypothetical protein [Tsukamurella paurometabola]MBS4104292.1 hypothetical protein [Tsukamurella paurometabola]
MKWPRKKTPEGARARNDGDHADFIIPWSAIDDEYVKQLDRGVGAELALVDSSDAIPNGLPDGWEGFNNPSAEKRVAAAHELWAPLLRNMPLTRQFLFNRLLDVRLIRVGNDEPGLAYAILSNETNMITILVGYDPRFELESPKYFLSIPHPLRKFIDGVHSSVETATLPHTAFPLFKSDMETLDALEWSVVDSDAFVESGFKTPLDRLMMIHSSGGGAYLCVSPDLPGKAIFWRSDAPPVVEDFWTLYDLAVLAICA